MKKGLSGDMILQIGIILIASITTIASVNIFYNAVEDAVLGDPVIAAKTLASYTDFVDSSNIPITIYHEIPTDFLGNPGYGTVLFNPTECEYTVSKYPQDYMSDMILNNAWDTVSIEEAVTYYALFKNNRQNRQIGLNRVQTRNQLDTLNAGEMSLAEYREKGYGATVSEVNQYRQNLINEKKFAEALRKQGIDYEDFKKALAQDIVDKEFTSKISETSANKARLNQELADASSRRSAQKAAAYELFLEKEGTIAALLPDNEFVRNYQMQELDRVLINEEARKNALFPDLLDLDENPSRADIDNAKASLVYQDADDLARALQDADDAYDNTVRTLTATLDDTKLDPKEIDRLLNSVDSRFNELDFKINPNADVAIKNIVQNIDDDTLKQVSELISKGNFDEAASLLRRSSFAHDNSLVKVGIFKKLRNSVIDKKSAAKGKVIDFVKYVGKGTGKGIKAVTTKSASITYNYGAKPLYRTVTTESFRKTSETAAKKVSNNFSALATKNMKRFAKINPFMSLCRASKSTPDPVSQAAGYTCHATQSILAGIWYSTDVLFTYIPTIYFINKAQRATEVVENSLVTISCNSENKEYYVKVPNCESSTDLYKPELQIPYLGAIPGFDEAFMDIFTMPKSKSTGITKNYNKIINSESACVDSHNKLLTGDKRIVEELVNPRETFATIPFFACAPLIGVAPDLTSSCVTGWSILYLSSWSDTENSEAIALSLGGLASYVAIKSNMGAGPGEKLIANAAYTSYYSILTATYLLNPYDSTNFFPTISKSRGVIDDKNNYYIENPFLIEISKKEHNGKLITEINKLV